MFDQIEFSYKFKRLCDKDQITTDAIYFLCQDFLKEIKVNLTYSIVIHTQNITFLQCLVEKFIDDSNIREPTLIEALENAENDGMLASSDSEIEVVDIPKEGLFFK
jgi:hypothetical protein